VRSKESEAQVVAESKPVALLVGPVVARHPRIRRDLERGKFQVVAAEWAWEALDIYRFVGDRVALVLVDDELPGDDPQAVVIALHRLDPRVRTLLVTKRLPTRCPPASCT
jgi:ActR/RegA family two-component response regulator